MQLSFRKTKLQDIKWVINLTEFDAESVHYLSCRSREEMLRSEEVRLNSIITNGLSPQVPPIPPFRAGSLICERTSVTGKIKVGFSVFQEGFLLPDYFAYEIHQISVPHIYRGKGIGSRILDHTIELLSGEDGAIFGRCFPTSEKMIAMLLKRDFELIAESNSTMYLAKGTDEERNEFGKVLRQILKGVLKK